MGSPEDEIIEKIKHANGFLISQRCYLLDKILESATSKELERAFPVLIELIFGINDYAGWGLRSLSRIHNPSEFDVLYRFLHPRGPLFHACYKLMANSYLQYDFSLNLLPAHIKKMITDGQIPPFYVNKVKIDFHTRTPTVLGLNPFEYYIFHFAYHLVNPWLQRGAELWSFWETPYLELVEAYLEHFLPCEGSVVVPRYPGISVPFMPLPVQTPSRPQHSSPLLKTPMLDHSSSPTVSTLLQQQQSVIEIWWGETLLQVFLDFYLSFGEKDPEQFANIQLRESLPCVEHVRIVRNVIKYLHYFSNSGTRDASAMNDLKRNVLLVSQGKIYKFLRQTFNKWPLDSSFRVVVETWLSFIRPWRYQDYRSRRHNKDEERPQAVDKKWLDIIVENFLAYTVLFEQLIPRFARIDLGTPKNANILYRITKVFAQDNLFSLLRDVEGCINSPKINHGPSVLSPNHKWMGLIQHQISELEGPGFRYKPMFGEECIVEVHKLMDLILRSCAQVQIKIEDSEMQMNRKSFGLLNWLKERFQSDANEKNEYTIEDRRRVVNWLKSSVTNFAKIFQINENVDDSMEAYLRLSRHSYSQSSSDSVYHSAPSSFGHGSSPDRPWTPPRSFQQKQKMLPERDPDLEPIRSTEIAFLVRCLYHFASVCNEMYSVELHNLYYRDDMWGRMARQVIKPPVEIYTYNKSNAARMYPCRQRTLLPPRLSFRGLASINLVFALIAFIGVMWIFFDHGPVTTLSIVVLLFAAKVFLWASFETLFPSSSHHEDYTDQSFSSSRNTSFGSSNMSH